MNNQSEQGGGGMIRQGQAITVQHLGGLKKGVQAVKVNQKTVLCSDGLLYSLTTGGAIGKQNRWFISEFHKLKNQTQN